jgi:hypothetical protein
MSDKEVTKVGPPVDEREDDGRKHDHGSAGPAPTGKRPYEHGAEVESRMKFLQDNPFHAKVVEPEAQAKPKGSSAASTK